MGGEAGPHAVERFGHLRGPPEAPGQFGLLFRARRGVGVGGQVGRQVGGEPLGRARPIAGTAVFAVFAVFEPLDAPGQPGPVVVGQSPQDVRLDEAPPDVVGAGAAAGQGDDLLGGLGP